jgi:ABC-type uncharacterized transport system substrate-binding protein
MNRKIFVFICLLLTVLLPAVLRGAQQANKVPRIGYLTSFGAPLRIDAFREGLKDLGYIEGKNILIEIRHPKGNIEEVRELVAELLKLKVDVLVAAETTAIRAAQQATKTVPIVMLTRQDPVAVGLVESLARPGGNVTGITRLSRELSGKRLELLKELVPGISRTGVLWVRPTELGAETAFKSYEAAAGALKLQLVSLQVGRPNPDLEGAFQTAVKERVSTLIAVSHAVLTPHQRKLAALAVKNRLPLMCESSRYVDDGCLVSYDTSDAESYRRAPIYVDKILKGAKPADLPIEGPTKFEFVINLKTAKALNLTIPQSVLYRADKVIK